MISLIRNGMEYSQSTIFIFAKCTFKHFDTFTLIPYLISTDILTSNSCLSIFFQFNITFFEMNLKLFDILLVFLRAERCINSCHRLLKSIQSQNIHSLPDNNSICLNMFFFTILSRFYRWIERSCSCWLLWLTKMTSYLNSANEYSGQKCSVIAANQLNTNWNDGALLGIGRRLARATAKIFPLKAFQMSVIRPLCSHNNKA